MKILGIETSCDETALAIIEVKGELNNPKISIIKEVLNSQVEIHKQYGGVYPMAAKREHILNLPILLKEIGLSKEDKPDIDFIAVTSGPGLEPCLWTGIKFAEELSQAWNIPILPTNHMEGHIASALLKQDFGNSKEQDTTNKIEFPILALLISGGHTELVYAKEWGEYEIVSHTLDDAVGEAYDKVARILGLPYPGGPEISKLAKSGRDENLSDVNIKFPRMMMNDNPNFSLSGLKTSVLYKVKEIGELTEDKKKIVAKEFENAVVDLLTRKTKSVIINRQPKTFISAGGVTANKYIKEKLTELATEFNIPAIFPPQNLSTDNAVMIAVAGYVKQFKTKPQMVLDIKAEGNLSLENLSK